MSAHSGASPFRQPKAVYAVAFACVVSFMGIGLVDPILPALASQLDATPSQVTLLFTSYLLVTAVAMLGTGWVSSRIGAKRTLITGLAIIVVFAALAGLSGSIGGIVGFRAGWGLGNALFIATSLAVIVASASGGFAGAIVLYETALGLGIAAGPLVGGLLGNITWRGPFFGVAVLMAVALLATVVLLDPTPTPPRRSSLSAPLRALRHRGLLTMSVTAVLYNWGFFTMLGYAPFPMRLSELQLGFVFFGWGLMVAVFSVFVAPKVRDRLGVVPTLAAMYTAVAAILVVMAIGESSPAVLAVSVIGAGAFLGIINTVLTEAVMRVSPVERPVASSAYSFLRFAGGAVAPWLAGKLAEGVSLQAPFLVGAAAVAVALGILLAGRRHITEHEPELPAQLRLAIDEEPAGAIAA